MAYTIQHLRSYGGSNDVGRQGWSLRPSPSKRARSFRKWISSSVKGKGDRIMRTPVISAWIGLTVVAAGPLYGLTITGQVVDSKAAAVQGAEVVVYQRIPTGLGWEQEAKILTPIVKSDAKGGFELQAEVTSQYDTFVVARKPGYAHAWDGLSYSHNTLGKGEFLLVLEPPCTVAGHLVDPNGRPVAGARIQALPVTSYLHRIRQRPVIGPVEWFTTATDSEGGFHFDQFAADVSTTFRVPGRSSLFSFRTQLMDACGFEVWRTGLRLVLPKVGTIRGRVQDEQAGPVSGVDVMIQGGRGRSEVADLYVPRRTKSGSQGAFVFDDLPEGPHRIEILTPDGGSSEWVGGSVESRVLADKVTGDVVVQVSRGGTAEVSVRDAKTGRPLPGAKVFLYGQTWRTDKPGVADSKGVARVRAPAGKYEAEVSAEGYTYWRIPEGVAITAGRTERLDAMLDPNPPKVAGRVLDSAGRPACDVCVGLHPFGDRVYTDGQGRFVAGCDRQYGAKGGLAVATSVQTGMAALAVLKENEMSRPVELVLAQAWTLRGQVADPNGAAIPAARVALTLDFKHCFSSLGAEALTGPDGRFEFRAIPPVQSGFNYRVSVNAAGFGPKGYTRIKPEGQPGAAVDVGTITLPPADQSLSGVVVDANGQPAPHVPISINGVAGEVQHPDKSTATNERGEFTFTRICRGVIRIQASFGSSPGGAGYVRTVIPCEPVKIILGKDLSRTPEASIKGKPLPSLAGLSKDLAEARTDGSPLLVCLCDLEQRPSRQCLVDLAKQADKLTAKAIRVVVVQTSKVDLKQYEAFLRANGIAFPIHTIEGDFEAMRSTWGAKSLPWLILTDKDLVVTGEGFAAAELGKPL